MPVKCTEISTCWIFLWVNGGSDKDHGGRTGVFSQVWILWMWCYSSFTCTAQSTSPDHSKTTLCLWNISLTLEAVKCTTTTVWLCILCCHRFPVITRTTLRCASYPISTWTWTHLCSCGSHQHKVLLVPPQYFCLAIVKYCSLFCLVIL